MSTATVVSGVVPKWGSVGRSMREDRATYTTSETPVAGAEPLPLLEMKERKTRVRQSLRTGERVPSTDMQEREFVRITPRALLAVIGSARRLSADESLYLFMLLAHSDNPQCLYATNEPYDTTPPTLGDWAHWLHVSTTQQVYNVRAGLYAKHIIRYVDDDPMKVQINEQWEQWDSSIFEAREKRPGAGRKPSPKTAVAKEPKTNKSVTKFTNLDEENTEQSTPANLDNDDRLNSRIERTKFTNLDDYTSEFRGGTDAARTVAASEGLLKHRNYRDKKRDANASRSVTSRTASSPADNAGEPVSEKKTPTPHQVQMVYIAEALTALREFLHYTGKWPSEGQLRQGVKWFYTARDSEPLPLADLLAWYQTNKREPFWSGRFLHFQTVANNYSEYHGDLAAYQQFVNGLTQQRQQKGNHNGNTSSPRGVQQPQRDRSAYDRHKAERDAERGAIHAHQRE